MGRFSDFLLTEVTADEKYTRQYVGKLDRADFDKAVALDPTSNGQAKTGKYVDWIIKNKVFDDTDVTQYLKKFDQYKEKLPADKRDINRMKYPDFAALIDTAEEEGLFVSKKDKESSEKEKAEDESRVVFQDDEYVVVVPETEFASKYFGSGADWCTARREQGRCFFDQYNRSGTLYIIKDKITKKLFQMYLPNNESVEYMEYRNQANREFDPEEEFSGNPDLINYLEKQGFNLKKYTEITGEEAMEYARAVFRYVGMTSNSVFYDGALDILTDTFENINEYGIDDDPHPYAEEKVNEIGREIEEILERLQEDYGIDKGDDDNIGQVIVQGYVDYQDGGDTFFNEVDIPSIEWKYLDFDDVFDDVYEVDGKALEKIERYASVLYKTNHDAFMRFADDFFEYLSKYKIPFDNSDREAVKEVLDKVEKKEYRAAGHPELELDSFMQKMKGKIVA